MQRPSIPAVLAFVGLAYLMIQLRAPKERAEAPEEFSRTEQLIGPDPVTGQRRVVTPDNHILSPAGKQVELPGMRPQAVALSPNGKVLVAAGKIAGIVPINPITGEVGKRIDLPGASEPAPDPVSPNILKPDRSGQLSFTGLCFSPDGTRLYLSNVNGSIKVFAVSDAGEITPLRNIPLAPANAPGRKVEIPSGLAISPDGRRLYVALNLSNKLAEVDVEKDVTLRTWDCGVAPFDVKLVGNKVIVSNWGGRRPDASSPSGPAGRGTFVRVDPRTSVANEGSVTIVDLTKSDPPRELVTGLHASAMAVSVDQKYVCVACSSSDYIAVLDVAKESFIGHYFPKQTPADLFGAAPTALAFSADGRFLYCCNGTQNAVAVMEFDEGKLEFEGLIPTGWYPGAIAVDPARGQLCVGNIKGITATKAKSTALGAGKMGFNTHQYFGTVSLIPLPADKKSIGDTTKLVVANNRVPLLKTAFAPPRPNVRLRPVPERVGEPSVFKHVVYVIKENRTYDQVLGDMPEGNGDASLCIFGEAVTPNQHKIAREFALLDNTYCSGILSADGHNWSCSAITTDYMERQFAGFPRSYPDGSNAESTDSLAWSPAGFIWDSVVAHKKSVRIFGEFASLNREWKDTSIKGKPVFADVCQDWNRHRGGPGSALSLRSVASIPTVAPHLCVDFPGYDNNVPDILRMQAFLTELKTWESTGEMPHLCVMSLPGNHTSATLAGMPTPRAHVADNDLAFGLLVEAISRSRFWKDTCIISIEDDPQNGWDHVSGYRTTCFVASAWSRGRGTVKTQYNQTSVLRTIELILGLPPMNELDATATPMMDCFGDEPNFDPYIAMKNTWPLDEINAAPAKISNAALRHDAEVSTTLPLEELDKCPEDVLNGILWRSTMGPTAPFPTWAIAEVEDDD